MDTNPSSPAFQQLLAQIPNSPNSQELYATAQGVQGESIQGLLLSMGVTPRPSGPVMEAYDPAAEQAYRANMNDLGYAEAGVIFGVGIPLARTLGANEAAVAASGEFGANVLLDAAGIPEEAALVPGTVDATTSAGSDWIKPAGWRLPATNGEWLGTPGNSGWLSYNGDVNAVTGGQPIPFNNGYPDFSQWSQGSFTFSNLTGTNSDFSLVYQAFADENGLANQTAGQNMLRDLELTPHHVEDGQTIQLIPTPLHSNVPHIGGASILRNGN